jgi:glycosyltransferase involved in cell wall biosynthesis
LSIVKVTAILCTYNRASSLAKALESLARSVVPESLDWEVLVVDNNSTDGTQSIVESFRGRYPRRFRYLFEPRQGKSVALNTGVRNTPSEVLAFLDDDVMVEPPWLYSLTARLIRGEYAGSGGRTLPQQILSLPSWLSLDGPLGMGGMVAALFDLGNEPCELPRAPYGANMAYRREMFEKYGLFRADLGPGPDGDVPRQSEDTEFGRRLIRAGEHLLYEPSAVVYHPICEERLQRGYLLNWWFDFGRAAAREQGKGLPLLGLPRGYFSVPKLALSSLSINAIRWLFTINPQRRFHSQCLTWSMLGRIVETCRLVGDTTIPENTLLHDTKLN